MVILLSISITCRANEGEAVHQETVYVTVGVLDIDSIDSAKQNFTVNLYLQFRWFDPGLAHDGANPVRRSLGEIHAPRILLLNQQKAWSSLVDVAEISPKGEVVYHSRLWGDFSQPLDLKKFPFDSHTFEIPILAIGYSGEPVLLLSDPAEESFMANRLSVADWSIQKWHANPRDIGLTGNKKTPGYVFAFFAERNYNHYLLKIIIPLILISAMSWVVFWIDPTLTATQLSVSVTAILTLIAYQIALSGNTPNISYLTRMDVFLFGSTLLVFSALVEVVYTSTLSQKGRLELARKADLTCRILFPATYLVIALVSLQW